MSTTTTVSPIWAFLALVLLVAFLALAGAALYRRQQEAKTRRREPKITVREPFTKIHLDPAPGTFTAAVLNSERAAAAYRTAIFQGTLAELNEQYRALINAHRSLMLSLAEREQAAKERAYASAPGGVTVTESNRLAGEPTLRPGDSHGNHRTRGRHR